MLVFMINIGDSGLMRRFIYILLVMGVAAALYLLEPDDTNAADTGNVPLITDGPPVADNNIAFDISVHDLDELRKVLQRAEELVSTPKSASQPANIELLLHGPEIKYFAINQYGQYKDIVDLAARLDAYNVVELKMCETAMKDFGVKKDDIPSFIEFVPNAEIELEKLSRRGFSIM